MEAEIKPNEGMWKGATIPFTIEVTEEYPIEPPKVLCKKVCLFKIYFLKETIPSQYRL